jgi:hypothetical protein
VTVDDGASPIPALPAPNGAMAVIRRLLGSAKRFWSDRESLLPRPLGWWRALWPAARQHDTARRAAPRRKRLRHNADRCCCATAMTAVAFQPLTFEAVCMVAALSRALVLPAILNSR